MILKVVPVGIFPETLCGAIPVNHPPFHQLNAIEGIQCGQAGRVTAGLTGKVQVKIEPLSFSLSS